MQSILRAIHEHVQFIFSLHYALEDEFTKSILKKNFIIIYSGAVLSIVIQFVNIIRVLTSNAGLSSANNRIYFYFYCALFFVSFFPLIFRNHWPKSHTFIYHLQFAFGIFYVIWNLLLNSYILHRQTNDSILIFTSALIFSSILFHFKIYHTVIFQIISSVAFLTINYYYLPLSNMINFTNAAIVTIFCTFILYSQELNLIHNQKELLKTNQELKNREDMLRLGLEKHQFIMDETNLFSFDWNLQKDICIPSRNCAETLGLPSFIEHPAKWFRNKELVFNADLNATIDLIQSCIREKKRGEIDLRLKDCSMNYTWYRLQIFIQCNHNNEPTLAIGVLLNIDGTTRLIHNLNMQLHTQITGTKQYLEQLKDEQEQAKIYRHDIRHSLKLMEQLASQGNMKKLCDYLEASQNELDSITPNHYCENEIANLILGSFEQLTRKQNIVFVTDVVLPQELPIVDTELCSLLFNLLENAVTAASNATEGSLRFVQIRSVYKNNKFLIFVENGFSGDLLMEDDLPLPLNQQENHGFGIKSIISIVEQHGGLHTFEVDDQKFYAKVLLEI